MAERSDRPSQGAGHVIAFYDRHPISAAQVLAKVEAHRGNLTDLTPEDLWPFDQDHYGGLAANDAIADRAGLGPGSLVLDLCAGLGGPARYHAVRRGCTVVAFDLNAGRMAGAARLNRLTGLEDRVLVVRGDAVHLPFAPGRFDAVLSQEAFLHVPDTAALLAGCHRVLKPGGRLVFTDWTAGAALTGADRGLLERGIAAQSIHPADDYRGLLVAAGFADVTVEDLSADWVPILRERLRMYQGLRQDAIAATGADPHKDYCEFYEAFVGLVENGALGGARFTAVK